MQILAVHPQSQGIRANGRPDFLKACHAGRKLRDERKKLRRRLANLCQPQGVVGAIMIYKRRLKLARKLRARFEMPYAVFLNHRIWHPDQSKIHAAGGTALLAGTRLTTAVGVAVGAATVAIYYLAIDPWVYVGASGAPKLRMPSWWFLGESLLAGMIAGTIAAGACAAIIRKRKSQRS